MELIESFFSSGKGGIFGLWLTFLLYWGRSEFNYKKLRSDSEARFRDSLIERINTVETQAAAERAACRQETADLRRELASISSRFLAFQLAVIQQVPASNIPDVLEKAMEERAHPTKKD